MRVWYLSYQRAVKEQMFQRIRAEPRTQWPHTKSMEVDVSSGQIRLPTMHDSLNFLLYTHF